MKVNSFFGDITVDGMAKTILKVLSRFSFDSASQLRVTTTGGNIGTVTTVTTVTTANTSIGDMGKTATSMLTSQQNFQCGVRQNFIKA